MYVCTTSTFFLLFILLYYCTYSEVPMNSTVYRTAALGAAVRYTVRYGELYYYLRLES